MIPSINLLHCHITLWKFDIRKKNKLRLNLISNGGGAIAEIMIAHLLTCTFNREITSRLQNCLSSYLPDTTPNDIVRLNLPVTDSLELPLTWLISTCLSHVWDQRSAGKISRLDVCRAELFSKLMLLRDTKWRHYSLHNSAVLLEDMLDLHFL